MSPEGARVDVRVGGSPCVRVRLRVHTRPHTHTPTNARTHVRVSSARARAQDQQTQVPAAAPAPPPSAATRRRQSPRFDPAAPERPPPSPTRAWAWRGRCLGCGEGVGGTLAAQLCAPDRSPAGGPRASVLSVEARRGAWGRGRATPDARSPGCTALYSWQVICSVQRTAVYKAQSCLQNTAYRVIYRAQGLRRIMGRFIAQQVVPVCQALAVLER